MPTRFDNKNDFNTDDNDELWNLLSVYADGEANPVETARVEALLKSDASYARQLAFVRTTAVAVHSFDEIEPPTRLRDAILEATSRRETFATRFAALRTSVLHSLAPRYSLSLVGLAAAGLLAFAIVHHNGGARSNTDSAKIGLNTGPRAVATVTAPHNTNIASNASTNRAVLPPDIKPQAPGMKIPGPPNSDSERIVQNDNPAKHDSMVVMNPAPHKNIVPKRGFDDASPTIVPAAYAPNMDNQNERAVADTTGTSAEDIPGPTVHTADVASTPVSPTPGGNPAPVTQPNKQDPEAAHVIVAKLPTLPPDPGQVLTRGDMARNRASMSARYDLSTVRTMERKDASISIIRGTF